MSKQENRASTKTRRHKGKGRKRSDQEIMKDGVRHWTQRAVFWQIQSEIHETAFSLLYEDFNTTKPRLSRDAYLSAAKERIIAGARKPD